MNTPPSTTDGQPKLLFMKKVLFLLILATAVLPAWSETIKDIRIVNQTGDSYDISSVAAFTSFTVGEEVPDRETIISSIAVDVNRMRESDRFSYVDARMEIVDGGVVLVYTVVAKYRLRRIEIIGGRKSGEKVRTKSELMIGQFADDAAFEQAAVKIREYYSDFWYPRVKVDWTSKVNEELGTVDVTYRIDEGRKLGIKRIEFEGNDLIDDGKLKKVIQQKQKRWHSFISGSGKYKAEVADADVFAIKSLYMNNGFLDVQVSEPLLDDARPKRAELTYTVSEGQRYRIGDVSLSGVREYEPDQVRRVVRLRRGDIAAYANIESGSESIRAYYGNRGYVRTIVRPIYNANADTGVVDIDYEVVEGTIGYIGSINISGNERTLDKVIRRELIMYPGERYNRSQLKASENILRNLNFFEYVIMTPVPVNGTETYDIDVQVKEKPTGQFAAGLGFSSVDALVSYIELSQGNFNWKTWPPIGAGQKFKVRAQLGTERNDVDVSFVEPWFLRRKLSFGADLFHREARYFSDAYEQSTDGGRLSLGKPFSQFTRGNLAYSLEQFDVFDVADSASDAIKNEEGQRLKSGLDFTWSFDTRDRFFNPSRGNKTTLSPHVAGGPMGGETDIFGARARTTQYWDLPGGLIFNLRGQLEAVEAYGDSKDAAQANPASIGDGVPIFDRLFVGGSYTLRGFEYRDVGPKDLTGTAIGGNSSAYASAELTFPLWSQIRGAAFYDWGFVNENSWDFNPSAFSDNWGIGLRLNIPGFPLSLDYAWPLNYDEFQDGKGRFNFLIGHSF
ncbi:MAG: outer membrane protein assembly factor BamA [Kiritimatiellales bacterium]|nr:outer membrane protein assembly factor BamA [Kiritimatiellales bacterium]